MEWDLKHSCWIVAPNDIPSKVGRFLRRYIDSVELLEVLLAMRNAPERSWTIPEIARALTITQDSARLRLGELTTRRLVTHDKNHATFAYDPETPDLDVAIELLAKLYEKRRTTVISLIFSGPSEDVRGFADAFRLRDD